MQDARCRMQDGGCRMQDAGCKMEDAGCRMEDNSQPATTKFLDVMRDIKEFLIKKRVGNVQVNMFKGGISNWSINETKK